MPGSKFLRSSWTGRRQEALGLVLTVVLMVLSWFLVHGLTRGMYEQFLPQGEPPAAVAPVTADGHSQLGPWGYFWSERAFHYRTTLMFAVDGYTDPSVLARDTAQQHPEGVDAWREYTLLMEPVYGQLYRWFGRPDETLAGFLVRLIPLVHVLLFLPIYLMARALGARPLLAAMGVAVYATCAMGFSRLAGSLLLKEDFALLWLLSFAALHFQADRRRSLGLLAAAAVCLTLAVASWHLSQFLALVVLGAVALLAGPRAGSAARWPVLVPASYLVAGVTAGLTPSLLARGFFLSLLMMLLLAWLLTALIARMRPAAMQRRGAWIGLLAGSFLVLGAASLLNRHFTGDYNHLFGLLIHKLAHGFQRPGHPGSLPFDVRVFWTSPFTSPTWSQIWSKLGWNVLLLGGAMTLGAAAWVRGRLDLGRQALVVMTGVFLCGWLLVERLGVVWLPFAAVLLAVAAEGMTRDRQGGPSAPSGPALLATLLVPVILLAAPAANLATVLKGQVETALRVNRGQPVHIGASDAAYWGFRTDLMRWLTTHTPGPGSDGLQGPPRAVVGDIGISTQVLLYTGRPVVLNSQFENRPIRRRYRRYLEALFAEDPRPLREFLQEVRAGYLFINRDWALGQGPGSAAYLAGITGPVTRKSNIARLHFWPDSLDFLQPVYNNEYFRLFRVGPADSTAALTWDRNHGNWWNPERFTFRQGELVDPQRDRRRLQQFEDRLVVLQQAQADLLRSAVAAAGTGRPTLPVLHRQYVEAKLQRWEQGDPGTDDVRLERLRHLIQAQLSATLSGGRGTLGQALAALYTRGLGPDQPGWRELLNRGMAEPSHLAAAAQLAGLLGQYREAAGLMQRAAAFFPLQDTRSGIGQPVLQAAPLARRIRQSAVWYHLAADHPQQAAALAGRYLPFVAPGSPEEKFLSRVAGLAP